MNTDNIPEELKSLDQWVCAWDNTKCPMSPYGYEGASYSNPETWGSFQQAYGCVEQGYYDYVGFVFCKSNGLVGIDIDTGFEDGLLTPLCVDIIKHCQSFLSILHQRIIDRFICCYFVYRFSTSICINCRIILCSFST